MQPVWRFYASGCEKQQESEVDRSASGYGLRFDVRGGEPVVLVVGEGDDGETELAEEDGVLEDGGVAHLVEGLFAA